MDGSRALLEFTTEPVQIAHELISAVHVQQGDSMFEQLAWCDLLERRLPVYSCVLELGLIGEHAGQHQHGWHLVRRHLLDALRLDANIVLNKAR